MRLVLFLQVVLLLILSGYTLLLQLENPLTVHLPLPWGTVFLPLGVVLALSLLIGGLYTSLLFVPRIVQLVVRQSKERAERRKLELTLEAALQAKLAEHTTELTSVPTDEQNGVSL